MEERCRGSTFTRPAGRASAARHFIHWQHSPLRNQFNGAHESRVSAILEPTVKCMLGVGIEPRT